jgi:hypothetical protein
MSDQEKIDAYKTNYEYQCKLNETQISSWENYANKMNAIIIVVLGISTFAISKLDILIEALFFWLFFVILVIYYIWVCYINKSHRIPRAIDTKGVENALTQYQLNLVEYYTSLNTALVDIFQSNNVKKEAIEKEVFIFVILFLIWLCMSML